MGRVFGGIEEIELRDLIGSVFEELMTPHKEEVTSLIKDLESLLQQDREELSARLDSFSQDQEQRLEEAAVRRKADMQEVQEQLDSLDLKVSRLDGLETRIASLESQRATIEEFEETLSSYASKLEKATDLTDVRGRLDAVEKTLRQKAGTSRTEDELGAIRKGLQAKVDAAEVEEKLEAAKQRVSTIQQQIQSSIGNLQQQLQKKADSLSISERVDRIEQQVTLMPLSSGTCETPNELHKRLEALDLSLQQKADNEAIDASLDMLEVRMSRKVDAETVEDSLRSLEQQLRQKADTADISERLAGLENRLSQQGLAQARASRLRISAGQHEADGTPTTPPRAQSRQPALPGQKVVRRAAGGGGGVWALEPQAPRSPRRGAGARRPSRERRGELQDSAPTNLRLQRPGRDSGDAEASPWATPREHWSVSRGRAEKAIQDTEACTPQLRRLAGAASQPGFATEISLSSPGSKLRAVSRDRGDVWRCAEAPSPSPGPRMWRPKRQA